MKFKLKYLLATALIPLFSGIATPNHSHKLNVAIEEIKEQAGNYHENEIVVSNISKKRFLAIAEKTNSSYVLDSLNTYTGRLILNDQTKITDIYSKYPHLISSFSLNYNAYISDVYNSDDASLAGRTTLDPANEPKYSTNQNYLEHINIRPAWSKTKGENVTLAIIDTGLNYRHDEFKDSLGASIVTSNSYSVDDGKTVAQAGLEIIDDTYFHGTMVAGLIAAQISNYGIAGIAPDVELMIIKCGVNSSGQFSSGTAGLGVALQYAIDNGADVINMSLETTTNTPFQTRLQTAVNKGIIVIGAAGNGVLNSSTGNMEGTSSSRYPAADTNCIGVGALDTVTASTTEYTLASYSNYGSRNTTVVAPGTGIYSTWMYTTYANVYGNAQGTSFSCPMVAAVVALYKSLHPTANFSEVNAMLQASSKDLGTLGRDNTFGYGLLDADALINGIPATLTLNYLDSEVDNTAVTIIKNHTSQYEMPTTSNSKAIEGWYYNSSFTGNKYVPYVDILASDTTLFAKYVDNTPIPVTSVTLTPSTLKLEQDQTYTLQLSVLPSNAADKSVTFTSTNPSVATISSSGLVTALVAGTTSIIATSNFDNDITGICELTVTAKRVQGTLTITRSNFASGSLAYNATDNWSAVATTGETVTGQGDLYSSASQTTMQSSSANYSTMYHNTSAIPGSITGITLTHASGTARTYGVYLNKTNALASKSDGTSVGNVIPGSGQLSIAASNDYRYFWLELSGGASTINSIVIDYLADATTDEKILDSISYTGSLTKSTYLDGDTFSPDGLTFKANYLGSSTPETLDIGDITFTPSTLVVGTTSVIASYQESGITKTTTITGLTVKSAPVTNEEMELTYTLTSLTASSEVGDTNNEFQMSITSTGTWNYSMIQMASGKSATFNITGFTGYTISEIQLVMASNASTGSGTITISADSESKVSKTGAFSSWSDSKAFAGASSGKSDTVTFSSLNIDCDKLTIAITASANSIYIKSINIKYGAVSLPQSNTELFLEKLSSMTCVDATNQTKINELTALYQEFSETEINDLKQTKLLDGENAYERYVYFLALYNHSTAVQNPTNTSLLETYQDSALWFIAVVSIFTIAGFAYIKKRKQELI